MAVLVAIPSADVYGSDLQLLESIAAMTAEGWRVAVVSPGDGPLVPHLRARGAAFSVTPFPVLRRADASPLRLPLLAWRALKSLFAIHRAIRSVRPDLIYVNTLTLPWWLLAARITRTPSVCHVHEAEDNSSRLVAMTLSAPLLLADRVIVNSRAAIDAVCIALPRMRGRLRLIYNGVPGPMRPPVVRVRSQDEPYRVAIVCRLSPRKAPDVALEAVALLRSQARDVALEICGTTFAGYEWYEDELRQRAAQADLHGAVTWSGYVSPIWSAMGRADVVVAPSLREPFGNAVVEAQLARRPVVASAALGHLETVIDGETGLLVQPGDSTALAAAVARLMDNPALADQLAEQGRQRALREFSAERYARQIIDLLADMTSRMSVRRESLQGEPS